MNWKRLIAVPALTGAIAASVMAGNGAGAAEPSFASPEIGMQVLDLMCVEQDGQAYDTPYTIARCQDARNRPGFAIEALVCEGLLGGTFKSAPSPSRPNRTTWICAPGAV
jgi:hypothetical protein